MESSFVYKNDRPWPNPRLKRAAIIGHTTDTTTRIWLRTAMPGDYTLLLYPTNKDSDNHLFNGFTAVPYVSLDSLPRYVRKITFTVPDYGRDSTKTKYLFIVSAVPVLHMTPVLVNADDSVLADVANLEDDLRDAWEHKLHDAERKALVTALFKLAHRGIRVSILSGDVHTAAVFRMVDAHGAVIYQLTSSAITYNKPRLLSWVLGKAVPDEGESKDGYRYERLALYTDSNFSIVRIKPQTDEVVFQLYGQQRISHPIPEEGEEDMPMTHSIAKIKLDFQ